MRKIFLLLFCCFSFWASAQKVTVSDEFLIRSDVAYELIGELNGRVLLFRDQANKFEVMGFDENMRSSWEKEVELNKRSPQVIGISTLRDSFTIFYRHRWKGNTILRAHRYDASANLRDSVIVKDLGYLIFTPDFDIVRSEDHSKIMIYFIEKQSNITAIVFDNERMEMLWEKNFTPDEFSIMEDMLHMVVDNEGGMHCLIEEDNFRFKRDKHHYKLFQYRAGFADIIQTRIDMQERLTYDLRVQYDNINKAVVAGGLYYDDNSARAEGSLMMRKPDGSASARITFHPFSDDFVESLIGRELKKNRGLEELVVQDIVLRQDGGLVLLGEENRNFARRMASAARLSYDGMTRNITDYYYDDIFAVSVNPDGTHDWEVAMHKKQYSQDDMGAFSSFFLFKNPAHLHLVFNDEIKFENTVSEYILKGTGNFDRNSILSTSNLKLRLRFRDAMQISHSRMLVPSERRGRMRIARIELN